MGKIIYQTVANQLSVMELQTTKGMGGK